MFNSSLIFPYFLSSRINVTDIRCGVTFCCDAFKFIAAGIH